MYYHNQLCLLTPAAVDEEYLLTADDIFLLICEMQAAEGVNCFCKTIVMLRAMLRTHSLAPVLDVLLKHINYEEFILSGMQQQHHAPLCHMSAVG